MVLRGERLRIVVRRGRKHPLILVPRERGVWDLDRVRMERGR
jgi:hypothetical protein